MEALHSLSIVVEARNEALEDAAKLCDNYGEWAPQWGEYKSQGAADKAAREIGDKIRSLIVKAK